jgi:hypothetical protein
VFKINKNKNPVLVSQKIKVTPPLNFKESTFFSDGLSYETYPTFIKVNNFCIAFFNGLILTLKNGFIKDSAVGLKFAKNFSLKYFAKQIIKNKIFILKKGSYISFFDA